MGELLILTTGGTIDKVYFDAKSDYQVGHTIIGQLLDQAMVTHPFRIVELLQKDSLELTDEDRELIHDTIRDDAASRVVVIHGTDTMTDTAARLEDLTDKTIVLTGSLSPARFAMTDAMFNVGMAIAAAQTAPPGVFIGMNGTVFPAKTVIKNRKMNRFENKI